MKRFLLRRIGVADDRANHAPNVLDCIEVVLQQADVLITGVLEGLSSSSGSKSRPQGVFDAVVPVTQAAADYLGSQSTMVQRTFSSELRRCVYHPTAQDEVAHAAVRFEDLHLLDSGEIDLSIEFALAEQAVSRGVEDVLPKLDALVSSLLGWTTVQPQLNPLKPKAFVSALQATLAKHAPDEKARAALLLPSAGLLGVGLRQLYREVVEWLRSQGVEPAESVGTLSGLGHGSLVTGKGDESSLARRMVTLDKLRKLLSGELEHSPGSPSFLHTVPASFVAMEDLKLIEPMMKRLAQRARLAADSEVKSVALIQPVVQEHRHGKQLGRQLGVEVVGMMLDRLAQDARLLAPVRDLIKTLEPVLIRLAQADPRFFSERQHPARQLLDQLTNRSLGFAAETEEGFVTFLSSVSNAAATLHRGACDATAFAQVLAGLASGWARDEAVQRRQHEDAARALLHAEQRNLLAQRVAEDFRPGMTGLDIPNWVREFLCGPWAQVVAESQLACMEGKADPDGYLALVDDLLWSVQVRRAQRNRRRLVQLVPGMLVRLRQGLQFIHYPPERLPAFFDALISLHEQAFDGPRALLPSSAAENEAAQVLVQMENADSQEVYESADCWIGDIEAQESGYLAEEPGPVSVTVQGPWTAQDLRTGVWVELMVQGVFVRAQLTWVSPHRTLFMFISRSGSAHSMSRRTMDRLRMQGLIRVVSDGHLVDGALDAVAQEAMQNELAQGAKPV